MGLPLEKTHELKANSDQEVEKQPEFQKEEDWVEEEGVGCQSARTQGSSEKEGIMAKEPEEVTVNILEVFSNLPVSPIQKLEAATVAYTSVDQLTPQIPIAQPSPPFAVDVTAFQKSWKEVRKQRQTETVENYKEKLQNEASVPFGPFFSQILPPIPLEMAPNVLNCSLFL